MKGNLGGISPLWSWVFVQTFATLGEIKTKRATSFFFSNVSGQHCLVSLLSWPPQVGCRPESDGCACLGKSPMFSFHRPPPPIALAYLPCVVPLLLQKMVDGANCLPGPRQRPAFPSFHRSHVLIAGPDVDVVRERMDERPAPALFTTVKSLRQPPPSLITANILAPSQ